MSLAPSPPSASRRPGPPRGDRYAGLRMILFLLVVMWVVEAIDAVDDHRLDDNGIRPRDAEGLIGVATAPFLHASWGHLVSNTVPFLLLGAIVAIGGARRVLVVCVTVALVAGLGTWLIAPAGTVHVGASGIVFGFATYLLTRGLFEHSLLHLAVGAFVGAFYGGVLLGGLIPQDGISWQGHLFGAVGGVVAAWLLAEERPGGRAGSASSHQPYV